uniref:Rho-GAP domain-containing protein n=1 Tax=Paramoeba aestuarina TaxID=180227 RepID=A0A7S4P4K0_9EUKA
MGGPPPPSRSPHAASHRQKKEEGLPSLPDIYAIGFQELDLRAEALLLGNTDMGAPWEAHILRCLERVENYTLLVSKQLVGMFLLVFMKESLTRFVVDVQTSQATTGIMGVMGNKGAVAVRVTLKNSTFCFINCHLNAHLENVLRRNQDYHDIIRRVFFRANSTGEETVTLMDHDHIFWMGDLNYRIEGISNNEVRTAIGSGNLDKLVDFDQLRRQVEQGLAFTEFSEGPLTFDPTYKYDNESIYYDTSEKRRVPAWCDRVLYRSKSAQLVGYRRHELMTSDHRPVSAIFAVDVKYTETEERSRVYNDICKQLDKLENEMLPDVTLQINEQNLVQFQNVYFLTSMTKTVTAVNTGQVTAKFKFVPKLNQRRFCQPWLRVSPSVGMMIPGESVTINLTVLVDKETAPALNMGNDKLEDIVIFHIENGKDYFINVTGDYNKTCFSCPLDYLTRFRSPIRTGAMDQGGDRLSIPKELWRIVDHLFRTGTEEEDLFLMSGVDTEMEQIRECLDTGKSFDDMAFNPHSMAEALIRFFEYLPKPVIPPHLIPKLLQVAGDQSACKKILAPAIPEVHYQVFFYITLFLKELLKKSSKNKLTAEKLGMVFARVLLGDAATITQQQKLACMTSFL